MKRVLLDLRPLQCGYADHGIGRYTLELTRSLLRENRLSPSTGVHCEALVFSGGDLPEDLDLAIGLLCPRIARTWIWDQAVLGLHLQRGRWNLLHNFVALGPLAAVSIPYFGANRTVATVHDLHLFRPDAEPVLQAYRSTQRIRVQSLAVQRARAIITDSDQVAMELTGLFPSLRRETSIYTFPPGVNHVGHTGSVSIQPEPAIRSNADPYFLTVGETAHKGLLWAVQRVQALRQKGQRVQLLMVGDAQSIRNQLTSLPDLDGIDLVGKVDEGTLKSLYGSAKGLLYPSDREGFGFPILEAQFQGCPALCFPIAPMKTLVAEETHILPQSQPEAWEAAMLRLVSDAGWRYLCSIQAREFAGRFTWERTAKQVLDLWHSILS